MQEENEVFIHLGSKEAIFTTKLCKYMNLQGQWEIALRELHFNGAICNIYSPHNYFLMVHNPKMLSNGKYFFEVLSEFILPEKYYVSTKELVHEMNIVLQGSSYFKDVVKIKWKDENTIMITLKEGYGIIFSYGLSIIFDISNSAKELLIKKQKNILKTNLNILIPKLLYVYCDLVSNQILGQTAKKYLHIAPIKNKNVNTVKIRSPQYVNLDKQNFETITIEIRDGEGHLIPFYKGVYDQYNLITMHLRRRILK